MSNREDAQKLPTSAEINKLVVDVADRVLAQGLDEIAEKGRGNYVSNVDLAMEYELSDELEKLFPEAGFIGEESYMPDPEAFEPARYNWLVDPVDGTTNLLHGLPFAVSVALCDGDEPIAAVVYAPEDGKSYLADRGHGAVCTERDGTVRKLSVDGSAAIRPVCICGMPYDRGKAHRNFTLAEQMYKMSADVKRIGPASLDICRVAENQSAAYCELDLQPWDTAAARLVLEEAGGVFSVIGDVNIAACPSFHNAMEAIAKSL